MNINLVEIFPDVLYQWIVEYVEFAPGRGFEHFETFVEQGSSCTPIGWSFVAAAIVRIAVQEFIERVDHFVPDPIRSVKSS